MTKLARLVRRGGPMRRWCYTGRHQATVGGRKTRSARRRRRGAPRREVLA